MGASLVLRDSATPVKGRWLTVLLWVRQDTAPARGRSLLFSLAVLRTNSTTEIFKEVPSYTVYNSMAVHSTRVG